MSVNCKKLGFSMSITIYEESVADGIPEIGTVVELW